MDRLVIISSRPQGVSSNTSTTHVSLATIVTVEGSANSVWVNIDRPWNTPDKSVDKMVVVLVSALKNIRTGIWARVLANWSSDGVGRTSNWKLSLMSLNILGKDATLLSLLQYIHRQGAYKRVAS